MALVHGKVSSQSVVRRAAAHVSPSQCVSSLQHLLEHAITKQSVLSRHLFCLTLYDVGHDAVLVSYLLRRKGLSAVGSWCRRS